MIPARPVPAPTACPKCGYVAAQSVCTYCKTLKPEWFRLDPALIPLVSPDHSPEDYARLHEHLLCLNAKRVRELIDIRAKADEEAALVFSKVIV